MDPLSLTASIIAILGAGSTISRGLRRIQQLKDAPELLLQLNNEITDLYLLIRVVDQLYHGHKYFRNQDSDAQQEAICAALTRAKRDVLELEKLIAYVLTRETDAGAEIDRLAWLRSQRKIIEMRNSLQRARGDLHALWMFANERGSSGRIQLSLEEVNLNLRELRSDQQKDRLILYESFQAISRQIDMLHAIRHEMAQATQQNVSAIAGPPLSASVVAPASHPEKSTTQSYPQRNLVSDVVRFKLKLNRRCEPFCLCSCHQRQYLGTPKVLQCIIGTFFMGYVGFPGFRNNCDITSCCARQKVAAYLIYTFPRWLMERAIHSTLTISQAKGLNFIIRCLRTRPTNAISFQAIAMAPPAGKSTFDCIMKMLLERRVSVLDVSTGGSSMLHVLFYIKKRRPLFRIASCVKLLLEEGSDIFLEDSAHLSPYQLAWHIRLGSLSPVPDLWDWFGNFTSDSNDPLEHLGLQPLHAVVLGLDSTVSLKDRLALTPRDLVNRPDRSGRTALSWAAQRRDIEAMKLLLQKGADPNIGDSGKRTPLYHSALDVVCLETLLDAGAAVNHQDTGGWTKLMWIAMEIDGPRYMEVLAKYGVDLNIRGNWKGTALHVAVQRENYNSVRWLLQNGADFHAVDQSGATPLCLAIAVRQYKTIRALLERYSREGHLAHPRCLLHIIAFHADCEMLLMLQEAKLSGIDAKQESLVDLDIPDGLADERTAMELAEWRRDNNAQFASMSFHPKDPDPQQRFDAFVSLVESLNTRNLEQARDGHSTSVDDNAQQASEQSRWYRCVRSKRTDISCYRYITLMSVLLISILVLRLHLYGKKDDRLLPPKLGR